MGRRIDLHGVDPLSYFSFQPVLHDWCNKGHDMCYPVSTKSFNILGKKQPRTVEKTLKS